MCVRTQAGCGTTHADLLHDEPVETIFPTFCLCEEEGCIVRDSVSCEWSTEFWAFGQTTWESDRPRFNA